MLRHFLRLSRLTLAVALLYNWLISVGGRTIRDGLRHLVDRIDRRDLSIFQIGLRFIERRFTMPCLSVFHCFLPITANYKVARKIFYENISCPPNNTPPDTLHHGGVYTKFNYSGGESTTWGKSYYW